jgi:hypothetical protein
MASFTFRKENEIKNEYASRIDEKTWMLNESTIRSLHAERKSRKEILHLLGTKHDFRLTMGQLNAQMRKWGLKVYGVKNWKAYPVPTLMIPDHKYLQLKTAEDMVLRHTLGSRYHILRSWLSARRFLQSSVRTLICVIHCLIPLQKISHQVMCR